MMTSGGGSIASPIVLLDSQVVNQTATVNSAWLDTRRGESFSIWVLIESVTGTADINVFADISPFTSVIASTSTDVTLYVPVSLVDAFATEAALRVYHVGNVADAELDLDYPFCQMRIRVVGDASNPSDTTVSVWVVRYN